MKRPILVFFFILSALLITCHAKAESGSEPAAGISDQDIQDLLQKNDRRGLISPETGRGEAPQPDPKV